jgi:hypothetical protein
MNSPQISLTLSALLAVSAWMLPLVAAQPSAVPSVSRNVDMILRAFNKKKYAVKEKFGVRVEKFKEVKSEPAVMNDIRAYAGVYTVPDLRFTLTLQVDAAGKVSGAGLDRAPADTGAWRAFTLRAARIEGALLTASKVYEDGRVEPLEGLFIRRTEFDSPTDPGKTRFGLGVLQRVEAGDVCLDRLFFERGASGLGRAQ